LLEALWLHQQHNVRNRSPRPIAETSPEPHARNAANVVQHLLVQRGGHPKGRRHRREAELEAPLSSPASSATRHELTTIRIGTIPERLMYDVKELNLKAGKKIKLTFANPDFMPHNLLIVKPGKADDVAAKALALGAKGFDVGFIPESPDIIWASKLLDHGKEEVIEFTAPTAPGDYQYVCTFPGHSLIMRGVMKVK
jgi:azurin